MKIGAPLPPATPRSHGPGASERAAPASRGAPVPPQAPEPLPPASVQAQQVAQQFGNAFMSAGRLATQLVRGLVTNPQTAQARRAEKRDSEQVEDGGSEPRSPDAEQGPDRSAGKQRPLMAAFAALKRTRLFRFRKTVRKRAGEIETTSTILLGDDDYAEKERNHHRARAWLGENQDETSFDQARREALFLQQLERQGAAPSRIARELSTQLGVSRDREFKHLLSDQVRPQMEALASRVGEAPVDERRALAAYVSRAAWQVGVQSAVTFEKLLAAAGAAEAAHLAASTGGVATRAAQLEQSLRRAASPAYRAALLDAGRGGLEALAGGAVKLTPEERHRTWVSLLRAAQSVEPDSHPMMAEAVVAGVLGTRRVNAAGTLAQAMGPALRAAPGGGSWGGQLIIALAARGEVKAAEQLAGTVRDVVHAELAGCVELFAGLRLVRGRPSSAGPSEADLLRELESRAALLVALLPTCSRVLEEGSAIPPAASPLVAEALLAMASLDVVGAIAPGQRLLRRALLAQERASPVFLTTLPRVALTLAQPQLVRPLVDLGFAPANFRSGGRLFSQKVATHLGRALAGPVLARTRKGDVPAAKVLLRSALRSNAELFGLAPEGARLAGDALEALRDKPGPLPLQRTLAILGRIRKQHALVKEPGGGEPLHALATALGARAGVGTSRRG